MPSSRPFRLLCTGDLHLGRRPSRVPADDPRLSVAAVWEALVAYAEAQRVDALVLTGDVVDRDNAFFEAYGPLERGLGRLVRAGIPTVAVAGNHDVDVLPRLVASFDSPFVRLLGRGGRWETATLRRDDAPVLRLAGWSFPQAHVPESPLRGFETPDGTVPTLGVLHADLDASERRYAPVRRAELLATPLAGWMLGHIHVPMLHEEGPRWLLYPGSPQPLDPGETGCRGPWIVDIAPDGTATPSLVPMATVRYDTWDVPLDDVPDRGAFEQRLVEALHAHRARAADEQPSLRHLVARLRLTGRTPLHRDLPKLVPEVQGALTLSLDAPSVSVDRIEPATRPALDLAALAQHPTPAGALAALLLRLDADAPLDPATEALVRRTEAAVRQAATRSAFRALPPPEPAAAERLRRQGLLLLDALVAQTEGAA